MIMDCTRADMKLGSNFPVSFAFQFTKPEDMPPPWRQSTDCQINESLKLLSGYLFASFGFEILTGINYIQKHSFFAKFPVEQGQAFVFTYLEQIGFQATYVCQFFAVFPQFEKYILCHVLRIFAALGEPECIILHPPVVLFVKIMECRAVVCLQKV